MKQLSDYPLVSFATACYDHNSVKELMDALAAQPDLSDMSEWHITPLEWREGVQAALNAKLFNELS